jgi:chromosome segregation ATPase
MRKIGDAKKGSVETGKTTLIDASGNKTITQYADGIATLRTEVNQYKTALGGLVTVTSTYNAQTNELISKNREVTTNLQEQTKELEKEKQLKQQLTTTTREHEQIIQREGESYKAVVKTIQEETHDMGTLTTTITTYKNKLGETVVETQKLDSNGKAVAQTTRTITKELNNAGNNANKASNGVKNLGDSAERANYGVRNLGWSLSDAFSRLANFYLASLPLRALQNGISNAVETVKEFDSALIEFRKVSDLAGESLTRYVAKLAEMGEITGSTMQAMVEASTEFRKSGFTDEDSAKLAVIAEKYRNIADEEISAGESASFIIAQMKAFNIEAGQAEHIIDAVYL